MPPPADRRVTRLAVLGDSTAVGLGDPLPDRTWRGVGPLVAEALGVGPASPASYLNVAFTGARMRCVRNEQLPAVLRLRPDVALLVVGMNDTLRSDFEPQSLAEDLEYVVSALHAEGTLVLGLRYHDHARVFRLPAALARALRARIAELNEVIDLVAVRTGIPCFDAGSMEHAYELSTWSVDRLHPSELGHRMLARGFTGLIADEGYEVLEPVSMVCSGGAQHGTAAHLGWLVAKGIPWLWRRGKDFLPYAAVIMARSAARTTARRVGEARGLVGAAREPVRRVP